MKSIIKCVIYGLGSGRDIVEKSLNNNVKIIGYSDSFYNERQFNEKPFYKPNELINLHFDYIIIAIGEKRTYELIYKKIMDLGICEDKIVKFFYIYFREGYDYANLRYREDMFKNYRDIEGLIFGISHGRDGVDVNELHGSWCNIAIGSQDLYYNFCQLKHIKNDYSNKIKGLKYIIIDMYTYTYFNYDVSLTSRAINYYFHSGFAENESHNFKYNKTYNGSIEEHLSKIYSEINYWKKFEYLFNKSINMKYNFNYLRKRKISESDISEIENYKYSSIETQKYSKTIQENIMLLENMLKLIAQINKDMKIYLILIPQYIEKERKIREVEKEWKKDFYNILNNLKKKYKFEFLDFKNYKSISSNKYFYYNDGHLNFRGAKEFTRLLNSYIKYN